MCFYSHFTKREVLKPREGRGLYRVTGSGQPGFAQFCLDLVLVQGSASPLPGFLGGPQPKRTQIIYSTNIIEPPLYAGQWAGLGCA